MLDAVRDRGGTRFDVELGEDVRHVMELRGRAGVSNRLPVLSWGAGSENPVNPATRAFIDELFPQREEVILDGGDHFSVTTNPVAVAGPIAEFVSRHSAAAALT